MSLTKFKFKMARLFFVKFSDVRFPFFVNICSQVFVFVTRV